MHFLLFLVSPPRPQKKFKITVGGFDTNVQREREREGEREGERERERKREREKERERGRGREGEKEREREGEGERERKREREREREKEREREGERERVRVRVNAIGLFTPPKMNTDVPKKGSISEWIFFFPTINFQGMYSTYFVHKIWFLWHEHTRTKTLPFYPFLPMSLKKHDPTDTSINSSGVPQLWEAYLPNVKLGLDRHILIQILLDELFVFLSQSCKWVSYWLHFGTHIMDEQYTPSSKSIKYMLHLQYNLGQSRTN